EDADRRADQEDAGVVDGVHERAHDEAAREERDPDGRALTYCTMDETM
ncbi:hypothetical protein PF007_g30729, partial [Phytophthora fragariae]